MAPAQDISPTKGESALDQAKAKRLQRCRFEKLRFLSSFLFMGFGKYRNCKRCSFKWLSLQVLTTINDSEFMDARSSPARHGRIGNFRFPTWLF